MLLPAFTAAQITSIAANTGKVSSTIPVGQRRKGLRVLNLMSMPVNIRDDSNQLIDRVAGTTYSEKEIYQPTINIIVEFDNATSGQVGAVTSNTSWQVYVETTDMPLGVAGRVP